MTAAAIIDWAAQTGLMVSLLIVIVLILRRPVARYIGAGAAYALWLLPLARLLMPPMTLPFIRQPVLESAIPPVASLPSAEMLPIGETVPILPILKRTDTAAMFNEPKLVISDSSILPETGAPFANNFDVTLTMITIWIGLAIAWLAFQLIKQYTFMRAMKAEAIRAPKSLDATIVAAMEFAGLRKRPDIWLSDYVQGPMVTGVAFPLILLPSDFEIRFKPS